MLNISHDDKGIFTVQLERTDKHNALDALMISELISQFQQIDKNPDCRAMVIRAAGSTFCAGGDIAWMQEAASYSYGRNVEDAKRLALLFRTLSQMSKPTIAMVQGPAYGGGVGLVACCDIVVAAKDVQFCLSEVLLGLVASVISPFVVAAIGARATKRYVLTAELFSAQRACELGLVHEVVESGLLESAVNKIIKHVLRGGPQAQIEAKELIRHVADSPLDDKLVKHTAEIIAKRRASEEGKEGLSAFLEKRPAHWVS